MNTTKRSRLCGVAALAWALAGQAAVPPPEQLLSGDTLAVLATPDCAKAEASEKDSPMAMLWQDPALRPFKDKLLTQVTNVVLAPIEREVGIKLGDYLEMAQGQFTLAVTRNGWTGSADPLPALVLILDSRDKADVLKKNLAQVRKKLVDAGKALKADKIRDVEFATLALDLPSDWGDAVGGKIEISFGQAGSVLLAGTSLKELERVVARLAGGGSGALAELPAYDADARAHFREAQCYGWIHFAPIGEVVGKLAAAAGENMTTPGVPAPDKVFAALGLSGLKTLAFATRQAPEGGEAKLFLGAPEDQRKGLLRLIATEAKDAGPPTFVPADAAQYSRWRLDGQKFWATLDGIANEIMPGMLGFLTAQIEAAMKEKDPAFDFKKNLVGNLGDDVIAYERVGKGKTLDDLASAPTLTLLASPNPDQLLQGVRAMMSMLPPPFSASDIKEREFTGRKIYSLPLPSMPGAQGGKEQGVHMTSSGGYLAVSTDAAMIEEYIRSGESKPKPLAGLAGLADAAQKVGGMGTGLFGYQNDLENTRLLVEVLRSNPDFLSAFLAESPLAQQSADADKMLKQWLDFSLLPPFEKIAKYFGITVFAGKVSPQGYALSFYTPNPPNFKK